MKRCSAFILLLCLAFTAQALALAAPKDTWASIRSKNFLLVGNADRQQMLDVATRLEQFHEVFSRLFPNYSAPSLVPTTVIVFKDDLSYQPFKPLYQGKPAMLAGYFQSGDDINYITLSAQKKKTGVGLSHVIFHEYTHLLINNSLRNAPSWLSEGLAEYCSSFEVGSDGRHAEFGAVLLSHLLLMRSNFIPLETLFAVDHSSLLYNERDQKNIFYAESWALVHYLLLGENGARRAQFEDFVRKLSVGTPVADAFHQSFKMEFAALESELLAYLESSQLPRQSLTFENNLPLKFDFEAKSITEAEARAHLGDLLLHTSRTDEAIALLKESLALDPAQPVAHASLGMAYARQRLFKEAEQHLRQAVAVDSKNYRTHYYFAFALSRQGMSEGLLIYSYPSEVVAEIRAHLESAIALNPYFPESYRLLAFVNLVMNERLDESVQLLRRALALAPNRGEYVYVLAQVYLRQEDFTAARAVLQQAVRSDTNGQIRADAQTLLDSIPSLEERVTRYKAMRESLDLANRESERKVEGKTTLVSVNDGSAPDDVTVPLLDEKTALRIALLDALRKPGPGEKQARGLLLQIDCSPRAGIIFSVSSGDHLLRLHNDELRRVNFTTYTREVRREMICGPREPANDVIVTYRPASGPKNRLDGEIIAVEFVPKDLEPQP